MPDLRLFGNHVFAAGTASTLRGADVVTTGLSLLSLGLGTMVVMLTDRYGGGIVALVGTACTVLTTAPFAVRGADADPALLQVLLFLRGMALAVSSAPAGAPTYAAVRPEQLPDATTTLNILRRIGGALGGAVSALVASAWLWQAQRHERLNPVPVPA